jgi:hypothetical protein
MRPLNQNPPVGDFRAGFLLPVYFPEHMKKTLTQEDPYLDFVIDQTMGDCRTYGIRFLAGYSGAGIALSLEIGKDGIFDPVPQTTTNLNQLIFYADDLPVGSDGNPGVAGLNFIQMPRNGEVLRFELIGATSETEAVVIVA